MVTRTLSIDKNSLDAMTITSFSNIMGLIHLFDSGNADIDNELQQVENKIRKLESASADLVVPFQHRAAAYYLLARYRAQHRQDSTTAVNSAHAALQECRKRSGEPDAACTALHAQLAALQAELARDRGEAETAEATALSQAAQAAELAGNDSDVRLAVAETYWRIARLRWRRGRASPSELAAGDRVLSPVLVRAPTWGRAQVVHAGLATLRALSSVSTDERLRWAGVAQAAAGAAVSGNPHLRHSYHEAFADLATISPLAPAPMGRP
jgi:hypothetical protein